MPVALITGSSRGIGRAVAVQLADDGYDIVVNYRTDSASAQAVLASVEARGRRALAVKADVTDAADLRKLFSVSTSQFGRLDVFVGNAGIAAFGSIAELNVDDFDRMWQINTRSTFLALAECSDAVNNGGRIVFISSSSVTALPPGSGAYSATKAASEILVQKAAQEFGARGITVNSVRPGPTRTETLLVDPAVIAAQTPLGRIGEPEDIATVVSFLASPGAGWVTGQAIAASGGLV